MRIDAIAAPKAANAIPTIERTIRPQRCRGRVIPRGPHGSCGEPEAHGPEDQADHEDPDGRGLEGTRREERRDERERTDGERQVTGGLGVVENSGGGGGFTSVPSLPPYTEGSVPSETALSLPLDIAEASNRQPALR